MQQVAPIFPAVTDRAYGDVSQHMIRQVRKIFDRDEVALKAINLFPAAPIKARRLLRENPDAHSVELLCMAANDDVLLYRFGKRGGRRVIWNFTTGNNKERTQ